MGVIVVKIADIRDFLKIHPEYYSMKNEIEMNKINSGKKYYFIGKCGHEFLSLPTNVFVNNELHCPVCSGRIVLVGFNDLWTTNPELASRLKNSNDGYKYTVGSNKQVEWECPDCGNIIWKSPSKMNQSLSFCQRCCSLNSYGEKFITGILNQLCEVYEKEKMFDWSGNKRYDFYLPERNCIIEVHGKQHYSNSDFSGFGGKSYIEEQLNDEYKKDIAIKNGIKNYIVIPNKKSNKEDIKHNIMESMLPTILCFTHDDIDWDKCHSFCLTNITKLICDYYENKEKDLLKIAKHFGYCKNTIRKHLKDGAMSRLCSYDPQENKQDANIKNGLRVVNNMSRKVLQKDSLGRIINKYPSIQSAQRDLKISHIWDVIVGQRKTAGGYIWEYVDD